MCQFLHFYNKRNSKFQLFCLGKLFVKGNYCTDGSGFVLSNLVTRTQLIDSQDLSSAEGLSKQIHCPHLSTEHAVGIRHLRRSQETLVKRLQQGRCWREEGRKDDRKEGQTRQK